MTTPTIVLLHGVGLDHTVWATVRTQLPGYHVVAPDLLGHGTSAAAPDGTTLADIAETVLRRIDTPDRDEAGVHLVGFSLGALVAQYIACFRPDLAATVTCVSSVYRRTPEQRSAVLGRLATAQQDFGATVTASIARWFDGTDVPAEQVARVRAVLESNDPRSFVNCYRVFATADAEIGAEIPRISAPMLAITGEHDPGSTPEMTRRLAHDVPGGRHTIVPGARHMLPVEQPGVLAGQLTAFLGEHTDV